MKNLKLYTFVFTLYCTTLLSYLLISCYLFYSENEHMKITDFNEILVKDFTLSGAIVLVLFLMLRKQLVATFNRNKEKE